MLSRLGNPYSLYGVAAIILVFCALVITTLDIDNPFRTLSGQAGPFENDNITCPENPIETFSREFARLRPNTEHGVPEAAPNEGGDPERPFDWVTTRTMFVL